MILIAGFVIFSLVLGFFIWLSLRVDCMPDKPKYDESAKTISGNNTGRCAEVGTGD